MIRVLFGQSVMFDMLSYEAETIRVTMAVDLVFLTRTNLCYIVDNCSVV